MNKRNILFMLLLMLSIGMKAQISIIDLMLYFRQTASIKHIWWYNMK